MTERTIRNYLRSGRVPFDERSKSTKIDPLSTEHAQAARTMIQACPRIPFKTVYLRLKEAGYTVEAIRRFSGALRGSQRASEVAPVFF